MVGDVKKLLSARPFVPFMFVTTGGSRYPVQTPDHCGIDPQSSRVHVWFDDSSGITVAGLHIGSIEQATLVP